jgi:hypothetical protein
MSEATVWRGFLRLAGAVALACLLFTLGGGGDDARRIETAIDRGAAALALVAATGFLAVGASARGAAGPPPAE